MIQSAPILSINQTPHLTDGAFFMPKNWQGIADMVYEKPASYLQHQYENAPTDNAKTYWLQKITDRANCGNTDAKKLLGKIQGAKRV